MHFLLRILPLCLLFAPAVAHAELLAGAAVVDVTPQTFPVLVNGGMTSRSISKVSSRLHARGLALSDGQTTLVIVVVDSCMMPRPLIDKAKQLASLKTGIPTDRMLISATHTHSAGSCMGALGTEPDPNYVPFLTTSLADTIAKAADNLAPAQIGFARIDAAEFTALRRWIRRPDRVVNDPFGNPTVRANMHAGAKPDDVTGESGPEDPELSLISVQTPDGKPIAVLANFSMHYFAGQSGISADYFGLFCAGLKQKLAPQSDFVGIMSHGCSGDIWRRDYTDPDSWTQLATVDDYANGLVERAIKAYQTIQHRRDVDLAMAERRMKLRYRVPDQQRLEWANRIVSEMGDRPPKTQEEIYAREQLFLHQRQETEVVVQALRVGDIAIATTPNETYAITGLRLKATSPLANTMVIELANGGDGYIPPPEQFPLGGYNTWPARSAGLEVTAEPKIVEAGMDLLEQVCDQPRREPQLSRGPASNAIAALNPVAWYRLDEFTGPRAVDSSGHHHDAIYEAGVTWYLAGPHSKRFCLNGQTNRSAMFAGGRLQARMPQIADRYSISLWFWNGMPIDGRDVTGWLYSRGRNHGASAYSEHLGIGGSSGNPGRLIFQSGDKPNDVVAGTTVIPRWKWQHVVFVREGASIRIYLNGKLELQATAANEFPQGFDRLFFAGSSSNRANWEGRLDEIALFDRPLTAKEINTLAPSPTEADVR